MISQQQPTTALIDPARQRYQHERIRHSNRVARALAMHAGLGWFYRQRLFQVYQHLINPGLTCA
ncbi:MAG: hypothetical protein HC837_17260 [Chloroflexaceae bacterium]|nr:hypothetical protein [Chloroflexaceae bacterium]